jgi:Flp pilus assembly pilin Flp
MEAFWSELSPAEQSQVNRALSRMGDDSSDVSGHATLAEYGLLLSLIAVLI